MASRRIDQHASPAASMISAGVVDTKLRIVMIGVIENPGKVDIGEVTAALRSATRFAANAEAITARRALMT
jgi:hypothetical protein